MVGEKTISTPTRLLACSFPKIMRPITPRFCMINFVQPRHASLTDSFPGAWFHSTPRVGALLVPNSSMDVCMPHKTIACEEALSDRALGSFTMSSRYMSVTAAYK